MSEATLQNDEQQERDFEVESVDHFYVVHGVIPELMANVAYCRRGHQEQNSRKILKCPYCPESLTDVDKDTRVELYRLPARKPIHCQIYLTCDNCGGKTGVILR